MTGGAAGERPPAPGSARPPVPIDIAPWWRSGRVQVLWAVLALALLVGALAPPLATQARRVEVFEALQFALLALAVPVLVVLSAPWRRAGLAAGWSGARDAEGVPVVERPRLTDRVAARRRRHPELARALAFLLLDLGAVVAWRLPASVDSIARHGWLSLLEAVTLVAAGVGLWLELIESPPLSPRVARPMRIALAAMAMWTVWVTAYVVGLSGSSVYRAYTHAPGRDLSVSADQALTTWILWFAALCAFLPVIFANLALWLRNDEDPDDALHRLMRDGRRRSHEWPSGERPPGTGAVGRGVES